MEFRRTYVRLIDQASLAGGTYGQGLYGSGTYGAPAEASVIPGLRLTALPLDETSAALV